MDHHRVLLFPSGLCLLHRESPPVWPTAFLQCFTVLPEQPQVLTPLSELCTSGRGCLSALWVLWAGELRGTPGALSLEQTQISPEAQVHSL